MVVARDRSGQTIDFIAGRGALTAEALHAGLLPKLQSDVMLVSDANAAYRRFAGEAGIAHEWVNLRKGVRSRRQTDTGEAIHVQNVNSYHGRFKNGCAILTGWPPAIWTITWAGSGQSTWGASQTASGS
jgi:hypothetical protein